MKFKRQHKGLYQVNLTPLIDIVFLLLIFFMVSTTFKKENHLLITLPESSSNFKQKVENTIEIIISDTGQFKINKTTLETNEIENIKSSLTLYTQTQNKKTVPVIINADAKTAHEFVVRAMDAVGQLGFVNINITTAKTTKKELK
jgi:biopolymer transport protein ExbD